MEIKPSGERDKKLIDFLERSGELLAELDPSQEAHREADAELLDQEQHDQWFETHTDL